MGLMTKEGKMRSGEADQDSTQPLDEGLGTEIAALFRGCGLEQDIPEVRGHAPRPITFDKD
jgi:hypothetical protein